LLAGPLRVDDLVTHRFPINAGAEAYTSLRSDPGALGVLLEYEPSAERRRTVGGTTAPAKEGVLRLGVIGAGAFARGTLLPALASFEDVRLAAVCTRSGASAKSVADRFGVPVASTDWREIVGSGEVDALIVATPHAEHAQIAAAALRAGKAVFVEKPLAIDQESLADVADAAAAGGLLLVGHNRRFAPLARRLHDAVAGPLLLQIRVAAGPLAPGHWLEDPQQGGRILGEISHFVDLATFLVGEPPAAVSAAGTGGSVMAMLRFANGSAASIAYGTGESGRLEKERVEAFGPTAAGILVDFERLQLFGGVTGTTKSRRDKGHRAQLRAFVDAALGHGGAPVPVEEQLLVAAASLAVLEAAATGASVPVRTPY
ncbi:MAG: Gfo/Idh/MocA family protein, partial [Gaiellaceae bacterium]